MAREVESGRYLLDRHVRVAQHVLGVKNEQLAQPVGNGSAACLLHYLGQILGRNAHLIGIIAYEMLFGMVRNGKFDELLQHLALTCGAHGTFHILTAFGIG